MAFVVVVAAVLTSDNGLSQAIKGVFGKATTQVTTGTTTTNP